jgi:two-component system chemotaxis response regulator CheB
MKRIRVLVVEDSLTVRRHIVDALTAAPDFVVVGEAEDGKQAIELCHVLRPDVITLDMMLPIMNGMAVTEYLMAYCPTPILIVSSSFNRGELYKTYDALAAGAVDVLEKPAGNEAHGSWERELVAKVKMASRIRIITHPRAKLRQSRQAFFPFVPSDMVRSDTQKSIIAIGASTGGPGAIVQILRGLEADFPIPILLVMHLAAAFNTHFAAWLSTQSKLNVRFAENNDRLPMLGQSGVILAPPGFHLSVHAGRLRLTTDPERNFCRPSVDVLFESLAHDLGTQTVAGLLTGMGRDGAEGLLALRRAGAQTFAQDEASCVVFGMPKEAVAIDAVDKILALSEIAPALTALTRQSGMRKTS